MKLFDIQAEYRDIANQLSDGELTPELETALAINQKMLWQKSENYAMIIKEISADEQAISNEIDRLSKMKEPPRGKLPTASPRDVPPSAFSKCSNWRFPIRTGK